MQTYQSTPDYYRDYIEHGWLKDQAAKAHKYIERWRGKNGKWYYRYKSKIQELQAKARRKKADPSEISRTADYGTKYARVMNVGIPEYDDGRGYKRGIRNTYDRNWTWTFNKGHDQPGISAGRKRAAKKGYAVKGYRGKTGSNLSSRGYSRAEGNVKLYEHRLYNQSTRRVPSDLEVRKYLKNDGKNSPSIVFKESKRYYDNYGTGTNNYLYRNQIAAERARKNRRAK